MSIGDSKSKHYSFLILCHVTVCVPIISIQDFGSHSSQEKGERETKRKLQEVEFRARSRWRVYLLTPLPHLGMIGQLCSPYPSPPPPPPKWVIRYWSTQRPQCWTSVMASVWRLWLHELILDSGGDWFLLLPLFDRMTVSRDIDCYSLAKFSEIVAGADICDCTWRVQHLLGEVGEHQQGLGEVSCCRLCWAKTVRRCLCACGNILSMPVDSNIMSTPIFCRRQYFVDANILSKPIFCRCQQFADANILSTPIFCWSQYIVFV